MYIITGVLCILQLKALGFTKIDAVDPSEGMFEAVKDKGVYRKYLKDFFPCVDLSIPTSKYSLCCQCVKGGKRFVSGH